MHNAFQRVIGLNDLCQHLGHVCMVLQRWTCMDICQISWPDSHAPEMAQPSTIAAMMKKVIVDPAHTAKVLSVTDEAFQYSLQKQGSACGQGLLCKSIGCTRIFRCSPNANNSQQLLVRGPI